jgi:hypothetical protein
MARELERFVALSPEPAHVDDVSALMSETFGDQIQFRAQLLQRGTVDSPLEVLETDPPSDSAIRPTTPTAAARPVDPPMHSLSAPEMPRELPGDARPPMALELTRPRVAPNSSGLPDAEPRTRVTGAPPQRGRSGLVVVALGLGVLALAGAWVAWDHRAALRGPGQVGASAVRTSVPTEPAVARETQRAIAPAPPSPPVPTTSNAPVAIEGSTTPTEVRAPDASSHEVEPSPTAALRHGPGPDEQHALRSPTPASSGHRASAATSAPQSSNATRPATGSGYLSVMSSADAEVFEGSRSMGHTPLMNRTLSSGHHTLHVVSADGSRDMEVDIETGVSAMLNVRW